MEEMRRKLPLVLLPPFLFMTACGVDPSSDRSDPWGREPDPALAPVSDVDAATVKELDRKGYLIVDQRETGCDAGPDVHCDGFSALYLGRENEADEKSPAEFACPGTEAPVDQWKCRRLDPPYVPNGGFKPKALSGSKPPTSGHAGPEAARPKAGIALSLLKLATTPPSRVAIP